MTLKTTVRKWLVDNLKPSGWHNGVPQLPIRNSPHIAVFDAPTWLYRAAFTSSNGVRMDLNSLIGIYVSFIYTYLLDNNAHTFVLMFDCKTPTPKYINEKPNAIPTPQESSGDGRTAWKRYFEKYYVDRNTNIDYMLNYIAQPGDKAPTSINYVLPDEWHNLLGNRDFKEYVSWLICNGVFHFAKVPPGKKLVVLGPDYGKQRIGEKVVTLDEEYQFEIYEADFAMSCLLRNFPSENFAIFSIDGDVLVNLAYDRGAHANLDNPENGFRTGVFVVTKFNLRGDIEEFVDINEFWRGIRNYMTNIRDKNGIPVNVLYPVQTFCSVLILAGNDYVENFPRIGPAKLFPALLDTILKGRFTEFIYRANSRSLLKLNAEAYFCFFMNCYKRNYAGIAYPQSGSKEKIIEVVASSLKKAYPDAASTLTLAFVRNVFANLHWNLHYMVTSCHGEVHESATQVSSSGESIYGFYTDYKKTPTGTYRVTRPSNTSLERFKNPF